MHHRRLSAAIAIAVLACATDVSAAGLFFTDRGVRPLSRGGAFVAGADDVGAIWYNPAGLPEAGTTLLADFSWLHFTSDVTRSSQLADSGGALHNYQFDKVSGAAGFLPIPTIGGSFAFKKPEGMSIAFGVFAPYSAITTYPLTVNGQPAATRYSLVSLDGSALVTLGGWWAYKPIEELSFGVGVEMLTGKFKSTVVFSASPQDAVIGAPEDPNYDALSGLDVGPIFAPSANFGIIGKPHKKVRIGLSGQLPFHINGKAKVNVKLPNAPEFDNAYQDGQDAHVKFDLPGIFRVGVEVRPIDRLRVEVAYVREFWSTHKSIDVNPDNIKMYGIVGFPSPFAVSPLTIPRNFQDSNSYRLGGEYSLDLEGYTLDFRGGLSYEESAIPKAYLSALTMDMNKVTVSIGGGLHIGNHWRLDAVYAHVFAAEVDVAPEEARVPRVNPVKGNPTTLQAINGGNYQARADVLGVGVQYRF